MIAHSGDGAEDTGQEGALVTRRALIGGVVGAGLLSVGASVHNVAMADELSAAGPDLQAGGHAAFRADAPQVYTRSQWNARSPKRPAKVVGRAPDRIVIHHTATANSSKRSLGHAFALSRKIQAWHMDRNGWDDAGQQLTISRGGIVMEGRNKSLKAVQAKDLAVGAHVLHHNDHTIGIENEGTYTKKQVPGRLWDSLVEVCVWLCRSYDLDPFQAIVGHRDFNNTACPGDRLYARLPELRRSVAARMDGPSDANNATGGPEAPIFPPFDGFG
ncbi:peptidoglycan recognition family protein [Actinomadura sp. KC345]|uniref:peptidoglycan recognition protein family protein n=1 Tax=Actinomadura sp. KC345 TaxID=2530371 RepID=UPI001FB5D6D2|nr:peptidoglycan recognition family protein [Actinomadura sp. KC345]